MPTTVLLNRGGGTVAGDDKAGEEVEAAFDKARLNVSVELLSGDKLAERAEELVGRGEELLIVGGGDGTISAAAEAVANTRTKLGILPLGTLNHFARDLGIPMDIDGAAELIANGEERRVDVAEMNGRIFINNSAIGLYPLMVLDRELQQKRLGRSKRLALLVASARTLLRFGHQRLTLTINDQEELVDTPLLFVGNNDYRIDLGAAGQRSSLQDGELCVLVMRKKTRIGFIAASIRALLNQSKEDDMVRLEHVERLRVASRRSYLTVSLDGEVVEVAPPLDYKIRKKALGVIAP